MTTSCYAARQWAGHATKLILVAGGALVVALVFARSSSSTSAAREPSPEEVRETAGHLAAYVSCCVDADKGTVSKVRIATTNKRYARVDILAYPRASAVNVVSRPASDAGDVSARTSLLTADANPGNCRQCCTGSARPRRMSGRA